MRAIPLALILSACGSESTTPAADGDSDTDVDADSDADTDTDSDSDTDTDTDTATDPGCNTPDVVCPEEHPHPGGLCEGDLACEYVEDPNTWHYTCSRGAWDADVDCQTEGGCSPPLTENCADPFAGELEGARIRIGPADMAEPFRPFTADDELDLIWGSQGSPMIAFRIDLEGAPAPPGCVLARFVLLSEAEGSSEATVDRIRLRCGQSLPTYAIVPFGGDLACATEAGEIPIRIEVVIEGIGEATVDVVVHYGIDEACWG